MLEAQLFVVLCGEDPPSALVMGNRVPRFQSTWVKGTPGYLLPRYQSSRVLMTLTMTIICAGDCEEKQVAARDKVVSLVAHLHNLQHPRFRTYFVCISLCHLNI